jgi:hypothetical protein
MKSASSMMAAALGLAAPAVARAETACEDVAKTANCVALTSRPSDGRGGWSRSLAKRK